MSWPAAKSDDPAAPTREGLGVCIEPQLRLSLDHVVVIDGRDHKVERRIGDRWQFLELETRDLKFMRGREIIALQADGRFHALVEPAPGKSSSGLLPPLVVGPGAHMRNQRRAAYVDACRAIADAGKAERQRIIAEVAAQRGEPAPHINSVDIWRKRDALYRATYGTAAFTDRDHLKGTRGPRVPDYQEKAIQVGINRWLRGTTKLTAYTAVVRAVRIFDANYRRIIDRQSLNPRWFDDDNRLRIPSQRTFERRCSAVDSMVSDWSRKGPRYAQQKYRTFSTTALPERPYQEVEVDHTTLDLRLIDRDGLILGRPDLIVFRDRATTMILGYAIGFDEPSFASFLHGLRHAMYPKDLTGYPMISRPWPCFGRIQNLHVDNALHFIGDNIRAAGRELGFNLVRLQPRQPWLKGGLERFFGSLNKGLVHALPGTTLQSISARQESEHLGEPSLTLDEFEAVLNYWICEVYHAGWRRPLGPIRGMGGSPLEEWSKKVRAYEPGLPPPPDLFIKLAGDRDQRTIQRNGISWDYITYESPELSRLLAHPQHRRRATGQATSKYEVIRDPNDLGQIYLVDPYNRSTLTLPATVAHRAYATGLALHRHQVVVAHAKRRRDDAGFEGLMRAMDELAAAGEQRRNHPSRKQIERTVARFFDGDRARRLRSSIEVLQPVQPSPSGMLDFGERATPAVVSGGGGAVSEVIPPEAVEQSAAGFSLEPIDEGNDEDDLASIRMRKGWVTTNEY